VFGVEESKILAMVNRKPEVGILIEKPIESFIISEQINRAFAES